LWVPFAAQVAKMNPGIQKLLYSNFRHTCINPINV
jgi:hypothetical protein